MQNYTLYELNEHVRRILALNFSEALWVRAEIGQISQSRGHFYLSLLQKDEDSDTIIAESEAILWQSQYRQIRKKIGADIDHLLQEGTAILLKAKPEFHERYGFKLHIEDLDPSYTLGQLEMKRREVLEALEAKNLLDKNKQHSIPLAIQHVAVLSSPKAAGYQDFIQQIEHNDYGYYFNLTLFPVAVQGEKVESEILAQLKKIERSKKPFDLVCLIRGGGSKLDLGAFDSQVLAEGLAQLSLPLISGIGHDINQTVVDRVAHTALKTPTAVADYIINHNLRFEAGLHQVALQIRQIQEHLLRKETLKINDLSKSLEWQFKQKILQENRLLEYIKEEIPKLNRFIIRSELQKMETLEQLNQLLSPEATLKRGYSLTLKDGKVIHSAKSLKKGDKIISKFKDGDKESEVK